MKTFLTLIILSFCAVVFSQNPDKITSLPLLQGTLVSQYSGYLEVNATAGRKFFYWFVESQRSPSSDPLVLWLNGGPGCSSMDGFFYEHGPYKFINPTRTTTFLIDNPYSWTKVANVIYLDSPAGVGFSYSNDESDYNNQDDTRTANDNYTFLKMFYELYPQFKGNDFWITGESYAGVYVPSLANKVLDGILDKSYVVPFKGVMVGNGVANADSVTLLNAYIPFLHGHGIISNFLNTQIMAACTSNPNSTDCNNLLNQAFNAMSDIDMYNIIGDCAHQRPTFSRKDKINIPYSKPSLIPPCTDAYDGTLYLNMMDVKKAIHVPNQLIWSICSAVVNSGYDRTPNSMVPIYKKLVANKLRVFIYSGDVDFAVPYTDTQVWTSNEMGYPPSNQNWKQWYYNDIQGQQVGGFVNDYSGSSFTFATIRGAGHMVPQFRPIAAFDMFTKVMAGKPL